MQAVHINPEVQQALKAGQPVVALESTIISHGMPYPQNLQMARDVEGIIRANGAVPATIAIMHGTPCVGLTDDQLEQLASRCGRLYCGALSYSNELNARARHVIQG